MGIRLKERLAFARAAKLLAAGLLAVGLPAAAQTVPAQPTGLVAEAGDGVVVLTWQAAPDQQRQEEFEGDLVIITTPADISRYEVSYAAGDGAFGTWTQHAASATTATVSGLANGVLHTFRLRAVNSTGDGPWAEVTATPISGLPEPEGAEAPPQPEVPDFVPDFGDLVGPTLVYRVGSPVETALPQAFAATYFGVLPELPDGLSFNTKSAVITGTPTTAQPRTAYTLTAFDDDGDQQELPFTIEVLEDNMPSFAGGVPDQTYRVGTTIDTLALPSATGGDGELVYALTPMLPAGLAFDPAGRTIAGTPTQVSARTTYTWTATDEDGDQATLTFAITVQPDRMPRFGGGVADQTYRVGSTIDTLALPSATGGDGELTYALAPALPASLVLDSADRSIGGTPTQTSARTMYTWTATDEDGDQAALTFTIEVQPDAMPRFGGGVADQTYRVGSTIDTLALPSATGGDGELAYTLAPTLPQGLALDPESPSIAGTPTQASARTTYTLTATDEDGDQATLTFAITVQPDRMPRFGSGVADQTYRVGTAIDALSLPRASSGDGDIAYALAPTLPSGLALDVSRRSISGTPRIAARRTTYTWTATDEDGDTATVTFAIEVEPDSMPMFGAASMADQRYRVSTAIIDLVLPSAAAGDGALRYALTPQLLPPGLALDIASQTISGTPTAQASRTVFTWTATDEDGDTATLTFAIEVGMAVTVAIADASGTEGETLSFPVTISDAVPVPVTVAYRTVDGSANAGEDFTAAAGSLTFAPGTTALRVDVAVSSDPKAEEDETFTVVLSDLVNAEFDDAQATGTIVDDDMEDARTEALGDTLGAFGRTLAADAVDALSGRFQEGPPTAPAAGSGYARSASGAGIAATVAGFFGSGDAHGRNAMGAGAQPALFAEGWSAFDSRASSRWTSALPGGDSFQMSFGGAEGSRGQWTLWGKGGISRVASDAGFAVDGRVNTGYLGVDARLPRNTLVGVAVARSNADFDYQRQGVAEGEIELRTTTLLPYIHWTLCNGLDLWALAGTGSGEATLADEFGETTTDTSLRLAAFGLRHELANGESLGWALKADAVTARLSADDAIDAIAAANANIQRLRMMVEGRREWPQDEQTRLGASFELGARFDGGDGSNGVGAELGGALDYRNMPLGLGLEVRGRYLLAHAESGFEDWGLSAALELDPGARNSGASLRLAPAWGTPESGVAGLWRSDRTMAHDLASGRAFRQQRPARLDVEMGYGFSTKRTGPLRLYGVVEAGSMPGLRFGARTVSGGGFGWSVEVDRLQGFAGRADHGILFRVGNALGSAPAALVPPSPSH